MLPKKLSAMMFLFLTASPIGSLVRLLMLMMEHFYPAATNQTSDTVTGDGTTTSNLYNIASTLFSSQRKFPLARIGLNGLTFGNGIAGAGAGAGAMGGHIQYNRHNITVEEIIQAVFHQYSIPIESFYHPLRNQPSWSSPLPTERLNQDLQMVIPWIFAFTTLIIIPLSLVVINALWRKGEVETAYRNKRVFLYEKCLEDYQKEILPDDIIVPFDQTTDSGDGDGDSDGDGNVSAKNNNNTNDSKVEWERDDIFIVIPKQGVPNDTNSEQLKTQLRQVSGTCAICISSYQKGETVVWSSSKDCAHAFHLSCIDEWMKKQFTSSCPCCRRSFIDSEVYTKMKISCRNVK